MEDVSISPDMHLSRKQWLMVETRELICLEFLLRAYAFPRLARFSENDLNCHLNFLHPDLPIMASFSTETHNQCIVPERVEFLRRQKSLAAVVRGPEGGIASELSLSVEVNKSTFDLVQK